MKKTASNSKLKLNLRSEKVRELTQRLSNQELAGVVGGAPGVGSASCSIIKGGI